MYVFHTLQPGQRPLDDVLYPLNELKVKHPDQHRWAAAKYKGRKHILKQHIPHLDCMWGDVVFLCPVHPDQLFAAIEQHLKMGVVSFPYYAIPINDLNVAQLAIWHFRSPMFDPAEVTPFDTSALDQSQDIPKATIAYFKAQRFMQETAKFFFHIPHVLHKGSIDVSVYPLRKTLLRA